MTVRTFGRKGQSEDAEMARRREAFLAEERARQANPPPPGEPQPEPRFGRSAAPVPAASVAQKSVGIAYLLWFFFGAVGAHRHYLGFHTSAVVQAGLWLMGWAMVLSMNLYALPVLLIVSLWMLADAFMIPSLCRDANARARRPDVQHVFA